MDPTFTQRWIRKFRILTISLIFSGALNIGLVCALLAIGWQNREPPFAFAQKALESASLTPSNRCVIREMMQRSFRELCTCLTNTELVEEGYTKRDLALAVLGSFRHVDLERALAGASLQRRTLPIEGDQTITLYPGLTDEQFKTVIQFVYLEKWPLTPEGLFKLVQKPARPREESLEAAFALTSQLDALRLLFHKTGAPQEQAALIQLAAEGNWDLLDGLAREQMQMLDLSVDKRRRVLLSYLALRSAMAAQLLLTTDFAFVLKNLDDRGILDVLDLAHDEKFEPFCLAILESPRSDAVWERAVRRLSIYRGEPLPDSFSLAEALARFVAPAPGKTPVQPPPAKLSVQWTMHTVQEGENLWKIARHYQVKVDAIIQANEMDKDRLYPGMILRIPPK